MKEIMERLNFKKNLDDDIEGVDDVEQKYGRKWERNYMLGTKNKIEKASRKIKAAEEIKG